MIRLLLMLLGADAIRGRWRLLMVAGGGWAGLGIFIFLDSLDAVTLIPVRNFGYLLMVEGVATLLVGISGLSGLTPRIRFAEGAALLLAGMLTIEAPWRSDVALALLLGSIFLVDGVLKIAAARIIRFRDWQHTQTAGLLGCGLAVLTLEPWPTWYVGTIGCNVGIALTLSGWSVLRLALRIRAMPSGAMISSLLSQGWVPGIPALEPPEAGELVIHVWTPGGAMESQALRRPLVDRYIAAVDAAGVVSTGHAALSAPGIYISHYPAVEIDRNPGDFGRVLRATADNDLPGRFLPSYAAEAAGWCEADAEVRFHDFDARRLHGFWAAYRADTTYNLTSRNCSTAVALALDAALEGRFSARRGRWFAALGALFCPELWLASLVRKRAESMAWTPGLVLDYARTLSAVVHPRQLGWLRALRLLRGRTPAVAGVAR